MKGVVFTEFIEFTESKYSFEICDKMLENSDLSTNGVFTQAGKYPFSDIVSMITTLSKISKKTKEKILEDYGKHLFPKLLLLYPKSIKAYKNAFSFISDIENVIHPEVKKLYEDSELPHFYDIKNKKDILELHYVSQKPLMDFAKGLMLGCAQYYNEKIDITYTLIPNTKFEANFIIKKN